MQNVRRIAATNMLAYTAVLVAAAVWLFQRRDITGTRGE